jgi:outer membrane receptor protein involved in Fe transport
MALALVCTTALTVPAMAQQAAPSTPTAALPEVTITAEKRTGTVQKTPISITAITGDELQAEGISSVAAAAAEIPGVSFKSAGPGLTEFEMRGLTSTGGESPTVGFYLDETPLTPPAMGQSGKVVIDPDLYDLNRLEVLRGPQGTLYGAGSMGGTIRLITNAPDPDKFEGSVEVGFSGTDGGGINHTGNAMLNIPLIDGKVALRVVVTDKWDDGWIDRIVLGPFPTEVDNGTARGNVAGAPVAKQYPDSNWERLDGQRAELLITPIEGLSIEPSVFFQRISQGAPNTIDSPPLNEAHYQPFDVPEPFNDSFALYSLVNKYDFSGIELTSATSYWKRQQHQVQDISEAMQYFIGGFFGPPEDFPFDIVPGGLGLGAGSISEEFRIASTGNDPWQWQIGTFYSGFDATSHVFSYYPGFQHIFGTTNLADNHRYLTVDQNAAFGETSYQILDVLKATVGLRWFSYDSSSATSVSGVSASGSSAVQYGKASDTGFTPKFNLSYTPTDDLTIYGTAAKGFRPGGPNSPLPLSGPASCAAALEALGLKSAPTEFGPDSVWSYELGEKANFLDQRVSVRGDIYYETWTGVQQQVAPACGFKFTENAGEADVYGSEIEVAVKLLPELTLTQNFGYTHATVSATSKAAGVVKGQRLLDVPNTTAATSLTFTTPISPEFTFVARATNEFVGDMQDITYTRNTLPSHDVVGLRAGVDSGEWSAFLFIDNLTNDHSLLSNTGALSANVSIFNRVATDEPRTIGVDMSYHF